MKTKIRIAPAGLRLLRALSMNLHSFIVLGFALLSWSTASGESQPADAQGAGAAPASSSTKMKTPEKEKAAVPDKQSASTVQKQTSSQSFIEFSCAEKSHGDSRRTGGGYAASARSLVGKAWAAHGRLSIG